MYWLLLDTQYADMTDIVDFLKLSLREQPSALV